MELPVEERRASAEGAGGEGVHSAGEGGGWRALLVPALLGGGLAVLLAGLGGKSYKFSIGYTDKFLINKKVN